MLPLGNRTEDSVIDFKWSTNAGTGAAITRATDGTISIYKGNNTTQSVAGVTDTEDFDGIVGIHHCRIDTSADAFYAVGEDYSVVLSAATIDGQTVNAVIAHFTIEKGFDEVDVVKFGGLAGTFASGVPAVNAVQLSGDTTGADNAEEFFDGMATAGDIASVLQRIGNFTATGNNTILGWLRAVLSKDAALPDGIGGTFDPANDSIEAIRDLVSEPTPWNPEWGTEVQDVLDDITVTDPGAPASHTTISKMLVAIWRYLYKKSTQTSTELKTYADNGTDVNSTASLSESGGTQTKDAAS